MIELPIPGSVIERGGGYAGGAGILGLVPMIAGAPTIADGAGPPLEEGVLGNTGGSGVISGIARACGGGGNGGGRGARKRRRAPMTTGTDMLSFDVCCPLTSGRAMIGGTLPWSVSVEVNENPCCCCYRKLNPT